MKVLRSCLKFYETCRTGDFYSGAKLVKIDGDSGASEALVHRVPVQISSASRAKQIYKNTD